MYSISQSKPSCLLSLFDKLREEEKEVDHRKKNTKGKSRRGLKEKTEAEKNAEVLDEEFNQKLKGDAKRREATSKSKPSKASKKRESSGSDETDAVTSKATKKQRTKSYSKVGSLKPRASSNVAAQPTKSRPEPAIKTKDKKDSQRRKSTGSVRFDSSVTQKPKLDLFAKSTTKSAPKRKKSKSSTKPSSSQSSGISTSESAGRRRKKSSTSGKSKKSALSMGGFDDTGGFL